MNIGFIGLGNMGRGMAANLRKAGQALTVHDMRRESAAALLDSGAAWADTPRALAAASDVVFTSLPTPADVLAVSAGDHGLAAGLRQGAAWFDLSTNGVDVVRRLHADLAPRGVAFLDAPVSGGPAGAASGRMAVWVGGEHAVFERCRALLDAMGDQVLYVGDIGAGTIAKLVHNVTSSTIAVVMSEVFTMGAKAGLDPLALWQAVSQGVIGRQRTFEKVATTILPGRFDPAKFALRLVHKDVQLALQLARDVNVPMRLCNLAGQEITEALNRGWGERDAAVFTLLQQERAGIEPFALPMDQIDAAMRSVSQPEKKP